jgi:hypothetical protein
MSNETEPMLTPDALAERWALTAQTLKKMRINGTGPRYVAVTGGCTIRYKMSDVLAYELANTHGGTDAQGTN